MIKKIRVLIIDDSAVVRQTLSGIISADPHLEVMATAADPYIAAERISEQIPDVITLDVEMPRMDGVTFLHRLMSQHPVPTIIVSSLAERNSETVLKALEYGAVDIIQKPQIGTKQFLEESRILLCDAIKAAAAAKLMPIKAASSKENSTRYTADAVIAAPRTRAMIKTTEKVVIVGASTGGTEAVKALLQSMPLDCPGVVVVLHMPEKFTASYARRLDSECAISVKEAENNDTVIRGRALIAPGNRHTLLGRSGARYYVEVKDGPLVSRHRPSVDVLFRSAARYAGKNAVGVILTGMGDDGARGMKEMKDAGSLNIAQNESTCVVFGMPKEAIKAGAVDEVVPLGDIARLVIKECGGLAC